MNVDKENDPEWKTTMADEAVAAPGVESFEDIFRREGLDLLTRRLRLGLKIGVPLYVAFLGLDFAHARDHWLPFLIIRVSLGLVALVVFALTNTDWGKRHISILSCGIIYTGAWGITMMTNMLGGFESTYYVGIMLTMFVSGLFFPWRFLASASFSVAVIATYFFSNLAYGTFSVDAALLPIFFLTGTGLLTCMATAAVEGARRENLHMRLQLETANDSLQELDKAKTGFFANVSHELRTPLMLILGPLESMIRGEAGDPQPLLSAMNANAHRLLRQVNMILNFSKLEAGRQDCNREVGQVSSVIEQLVAGATPYAAQRGIELRQIDSCVLPEIPFDQEQIETSCANLLSNAMKFTPDGGKVTVTTGHDQDRVWIEVADTGCGIPQADIEKVFVRFHQVDGGKTGKIQGTGLGLSLSKELVELHGGSLGVRSELGQGTTFRIELPTLDASDFKQSAAQDPTTNKEEVQTVARISSNQTRFADLGRSALQTDTPTNQGPEGAPLLLVVEDNPDMRAFVSQSLARRYRVETAADGLLGLEAARRHRPDMIISDVQMPNLDGFGMVEELRKDKTFDKTPIIMLTAKTGSDAVVRGLKLGAVDYVSKPFKMIEIEARIAAQLRMAEVERTLDERDSRLVAVGQMTGTIAHDMRGPLTAIFNRIELLRMMADMAGSLDSFDGDLTAIENTVRRINNMIQELLEFVRGNNLTLNLQSTPLGGFLEKMAIDFDSSLKNVEIELIQEIHLGANVALTLDRDRIMRVIENLVNNSRDALVMEDQRENRKIWLQATAFDDEVHIRVADNGPGIPEEVAKNLFQPFATFGKANGTGLGLSIVRNIVTAHGGKIEADYAPPEGGAAFLIKLPLKTGLEQQEMAIASA